MQIKVAVIQMTVFQEKLQNIATVERYLQRFVKEQIDLVVLPEMFNCPYPASNFPIYAESEGGECWQLLSALARQYNIYLVAGSMPERDNNLVYNTTYVFDRNGRQIAKYRKMHLFDIDIQNGQKFKESDTLTPGNCLAIFETEFCKIGLAICFDIRFPELFRLMIEQGVQAIIVPGAFNKTTGPAHWEMLFRTRAVDNQVFMIGVAPALDPTFSYKSWGHSIIVDPWGSVVEQMDENEGYIIRELDLTKVLQVREELPLLNSRRRDIYAVINK